MDPVTEEINDILDSNPVADEINAMIHSENDVAYEIEQIIENSDNSEVMDEINEYLMHYGVGIDDGAPGPGSGRYPKGSGKNPYQHEEDFLTRYYNLEAKGLTKSQIAAEMGIIGPSGKPSSTKLTAQFRAALDDKRLKQYVKWQELRDQGKSYEEIAKLTGAAGESTVREALKHPERLEKAKLARNTAELLKGMIQENPKAVIDVGEQSSSLLGITDQRLDEALYLLQQEGYNVYGNYKVPQATNSGKLTTMKVLAAEDVRYQDLYHRPEDGLPIDIRPVTESKRVLVDAGNDIMPAFQYPESVSSKRLQVVYGDDGGREKDGLVELRRGVEDISLGDAHYSQVRILVDGTHYIKGMAVYADDLPDGIDIRFNTNKSKDIPVIGPKGDKNCVLKPISDDPSNPFNSLIKERGGQSTYIGEDGKEHLRVINKRADQGDWTEWADSLPSQFLSKQPKSLIKQQLNISLKDKEDQLNDILNITNPVIKEDRLRAFADSCDKAAVTLKAAPFANQKWHVILPVPEMGDSQIFAPQYQDGTKVALVRYPHGGIFEIPVLTVNNKQPKAKKMIGNDSIDAVGISAKVAGVLSGADFDGDTVMLIPITQKSNINHAEPLKGLKGFDPQMAYPGVKADGSPIRPGIKYLSKKDTQKEMGIISNLITDMTIKGANADELAAAVRHSMVVIDAAKHSLDYKKSEYENHIDDLKRKYQINPDNKKGYGGAGTLISRAKSEVDVPKRKGAPRIDEEGNVYYNTAPDSERFYNKSKPVYQKDDRGRFIRDEKGNKIPETTIDKWTGRERPVYEKDPHVSEKVTKSTKMAEAKDARALSSGYEVEEIYAQYANALKDMAKTARKASLNAGEHIYKKEAAIAYKDEVDSLLTQLRIAQQNAPYERQAQAAAHQEIEARKRMDDSIYKEKSNLKKLQDRTIKKYRLMYGAKRSTVDITPKQWEAIQSGAIRKETLKGILRYADEGVINKYAMPRHSENALPAQKINRIKSLAASNYSLAQIAEATGISVSTINKYLHD